MVADPPRWVGTWCASPQLTEPHNLPPSPGLAGNTLRQRCRISLGGERFRLRLSNEFSEEPLTVDAVSVAIPGEADAIEPDSAVAVTFAGSPRVTLAPGTALDSDPFELRLPPLGDVAVTLRYGAVPAGITGHPGSRTTSYLATGAAPQAARLPGAVRVEHWYSLAGLEVLAAPQAGALVVVGDSLTDGRGSTTDGNDRWPDLLSRRLRAGEATAQVAVLNAGIGGNALLAGGIGPTALARFERDVLAQRGVRWVILFEGINDVGCATSVEIAPRLIAGYQRLVAMAHSRGLRAIGATLTPCGGSFYDTPVREAARCVVNDWIRNGGGFDAVVDLEAAVRDPSQPSRLLPAFDGGDGLHLTPAGYRALAAAIPLALFTVDAELAPAAGTHERGRGAAD